MTGLTRRLTALEEIAEHKRQQGQPHWIFDPRTDDLAVQEIFQLVNDDEKNQREQSHARRNREAHAYDERVADEIAYNRQQTTHEGNYDDQRCIGQLDGHDKQGCQQRVD